MEGWAEGPGAGATLGLAPNECQDLTARASSTAASSIELDPSPAVLVNKDATADEQCDDQRRQGHRPCVWYDSGADLSTGHRPGTVPTSHWTPRHPCRRISRTGTEPSVSESRQTQRI